MAEPSPHPLSQWSGTARGPCGTAGMAGSTKQYMHVRLHYSMLSTGWQGLQHRAAYVTQHGVQRSMHRLDRSSIRASVILHAWQGEPCK